MTSSSTISNTFWQVADILRGSLVSHEVAEATATLFFLKRLTDSVREVQQSWLSDYPRLCEEILLFSWEDLIKQPKPGQTLLRLLRTIEQNIPRLSGLSERSSLGRFLGAEPSPEVQMREVFQILNTVFLGDLECHDASEIFQQLLDGMADRSAGSSVTPFSVRKLLVEIVKTETRGEIYDPVCGYASLLCDFARTRKPSDSTMHLYGQELQPGVALIATLNTMLGHWDSDIQVGDTLTSPQHLNGDKLKAFDVVLANPPFGLRIQRDQLENDRFGRFESAQPLFLEVGIIQHIAKSLADYGRAAVLVPNGFLFRAGSDYKVRQELIENDRIHAVISLPTHLFASTAIATSVLVLNGPKRHDVRKNITFIDLCSFAEGQKTRQYLNDEGIAAAAACVAQPSEREGISAVVSKDALLANDYNLSVARYLQMVSTEEHRFQEELSKLASAIEERNRAEQKAISLLNAITLKTEVIQ